MTHFLFSQATGAKSIFGFLKTSLIGAVAITATMSMAQADVVSSIKGGAGELVGTPYRLNFEDLPAAVQANIPENRPMITDLPTGVRFRVPDGFEVNLFASELLSPHSMAISPTGDVFVTEANAGQVRVLRDTNKDGVADVSYVFASGFRMPSGIVFRNGGLYLADQRAVWHLQPNDSGKKAQTRQPITRAGGLGQANGHWTREIAIAPNGIDLYVAIGSARNLAQEKEPRATIQKLDLEQGSLVTYASGLRNPAGLAFYPDTDRLFSVVGERHGYGDDMVPDFMTEVREGGFYGWPYAYLGAHSDPRFGRIRPDLVAKTLTPDLLLEPHSTPSGLVFYQGNQFPDEYRGDAFVALRGSSNRSIPTGYKIVRVPFENGVPTGSYETFAVGFWHQGEETAKIWGRPSGLVVAHDGTLLISDDANGAIWRVSAKSP
ncbi:MAG: PQQ-dependent sugar dehydrogenase [Parvibaculaceae bacterium]|nr:PQQ-dependent sugar dehydrogenase [Parvibaculaceae bacterium]